MPRTRNAVGEPAGKTTTAKATEAPAKSGGTKSKVSKSAEKPSAEADKPIAPAAQAEKQPKPKRGSSSSPAAEPAPAATEAAPVSVPEGVAHTAGAGPKPDIGAPDVKAPVESVPQAAPSEESKAYEAEPPDQLGGISLPASRGTAMMFGGPRDHSRKPDDKLGLPTGLHFQYERARSLNPNAFYCSMRWDYRQQHMSTEEGKRWWANKKILVTNPATGARVVLKAVDHGPHETTGFAIGISPGAAEALGIEAGQEVEVKFADQKAHLGPVE
jgi:hypothetical protein